MYDQNNINKNLRRAAFAGNLEEVKAYLSSGGNPNLLVDYSDKDTLLHRIDSVKVLKELLLRGARVNETNLYRETPLHAAITLNKSLEFVRELLKHGAAVDATNRKGNTALNHAVKKTGDRRKIIEELLRYGADINIKNRERSNYENCYSALDNAIYRRSSLDLAKLLIKYEFLRSSNLIFYYNCYNDSITETLSSYLNDCLCEVIKMKTDEIKIGLPLYNLVKGKLNTCTNSLFLRLSNMDFSINYPIYNDIILHKIEQFLKRVELIKNVKRLQIYTLDNGDEKEESIMLDPHSMPFISEYLSSGDLFNLIVASISCRIESLNFSDNLDGLDARLDESSPLSKYAKHVKLS